MDKELKEGDRVRVKETGEIGFIRHVMYLQLKKTYMVGEIASSYSRSEIELFDKSIERDRKIDTILHP
jgi:hypothetical protein